MPGVLGRREGCYFQRRWSRFRARPSLVVKSGARTPGTLYYLGVEAGPWGSHETKPKDKPGRRALRARSKNRAADQTNHCAMEENPAGMRVEEHAKASYQLSLRYPTSNFLNVPSRGSPCSCPPSSGPARPDTT